MSTTFEDRLERELLDAARRHARATAPDAPAATPRGGRRASSLLPHAPRPATRFPRPALAAVAACVALLGIAGLALALARAGGGGRATIAAAPRQPLPRQCDAAAVRGRLRLVSTPVDRGLLDAYAVLRRPQTPADRGTCPGAAMTGRLNPGGIRRVGRDPDGHAVFLVPMAGVPDLERAFEHGDLRAPWKIPYMTGARLCPTIVYPNSGAGGSCYPPSFFGRGRFLPASSRARGAISVGVFSDGVAAVELRFLDGASRRIAIRDNAAVLFLPGRTATPANSVAGYDLLDADGMVLASRGADRGLRPPSGEVMPVAPSLGGP